MVMNSCKLISLVVQWGLEDKEFKAILSYVVSLRPTWDT